MALAVRDRLVVIDGVEEGLGVPHCDADAETDGDSDAESEMLGLPDTLAETD